MDDKQIKEKINQIVNDKISGSTYIASKIKNIFPLIPEKIFIPTITRFLESHSSMASIINRINFLCLQKEGKVVDKTPDISKKIFQSFWKDNQNRKNWITLSMSHSVIECFRCNPERQNIILGISYPDKEGIYTYRKLKVFHNTTIMEDGKLISEMEHSDGVILGADLITDDFVVNKTGSYSLGLAADYFNKPFFIMSSGEKLLGENLIPFYKLKIREQNSRVIHYFERIPRNWITKIFLTSKTYNFPLSSSLKQILQERKQ